MIIGAWISVFLTLAILSYLYKDNLFYKVAEHVFVGISTGYWTYMFFCMEVIAIHQKSSLFIINQHLNYTSSLFIINPPPPPPSQRATTRMATAIKEK